MTSLPKHMPVPPTDREAKLARISSLRLAAFRKGDLRVRLDKSKEPVVLPAAAVRFLVELLSTMAEGDAAALVSIHAELTTQQAADLLGVSRPFLVKLLDDERIPSRKIGTHRRVFFKDLIRFKHEIDGKRLKTLDKLAAEAQKRGMGY